VESYFNWNDYREHGKSEGGLDDNIEINVTETGCERIWV
jgi:hypothetical protein